jgi:hypothetical protein
VENGLNTNNQSRPVSGLEVAKPHLDTIVSSALRRRRSVKPERTRRVGSCIPSGHSSNIECLSTARIEGESERALKRMILDIRPSHDEI